MRVSKVCVSSIAAIAAAGLFAQPLLAQDQGGQPDWIEQAKVMAAMEGVSVGEAVRRGQLQNKILRQAERFAGDPNYAGSWIERNGTTFKTYFAFKGDKAPAKGFDDAEVQQSSELVAAKHSLQEIETERRRLSGLLSSLNVAFSVRTRENDLVVHAADAAAVERALAGGGGKAAFVKIEDRALYLAPEATIYGGGPVSGAQDCTAAFTVTNGSVRGISTAGHCPLMSTHRGLPIGTRMAERDSGAVDVSWYRNTAHTYTNAIPYGTGYYYITSVAPRNAPANTSVCVLRRTNVQACAYIAEPYFYAGGRGPFVRVDRHNTTGTDSGGPWFYGSVAYGIHAGAVCYDVAKTDCPYGYYTAAPELSAMGLSVVTTP